MTWRLYDTEIVRSLRRAVKEQALRSGVSGYRKRWWSGPRTRGQTTFLYLWLGFIAIRIMVERAVSPTGAAAISGCAALAFAGLALLRMKSLRNSLTLSFERAQSYFYPISESEFVTRALLRAATRLWWLPILALGIFRVLQRGNSAQVWAMAALAGIAEMLVVLALIYALEEHLEVVPKWLPLGLLGIAALWLMTPTQHGIGQQIWVNILPTGWPSLVLFRSWPDEEKIAALIGVTAVSGTSAYLLAKRRCAGLVRAFQMSLETERAPGLPEVTDTTERPAESWSVLYGPDITGMEEEEEAGAVQPLPIQATWQRQKISAIGEEWGEVVRQGLWLQSEGWSRLRWIEGAVTRWLNDEEKDTFWFLTAGKVPDWSNQWKISVIALAVGILLTNVLQGDWKWLGIVAIFSSILIGLPVAGGKWLATSPAWISGKIAPMYATYPLGYIQGSRVIAKANLVRTAAWAPLFAILVVANASLAKAPIGHAMILAAKMFLMWLAWIPFTILGKFSKGSNDTSISNARQLLLIPMGLAVASALVILVGITFMFEGLTGFLAGVFAIMLGVGTWAAYGFWYNREVDLLRDRE